MKKVVDDNREMEQREWWSDGGEMGCPQNTGLGIYYVQCVDLRPRLPTYWCLGELNIRHSRILF
jgi:hypothetical protein